MRGEYACPCCSKNTIGKDGDYLCDYCGWDDEFETRGVEEDISNQLSFDESKCLVESGKNLVNGKGLPLEWYTKKEEEI